MVYNKTTAETSIDEIKMRNNMKYFQNMIQKEAENITIKLQTMQGSKSQSLPMAISRQQYQECGVTQMLGVVTEFHGLTDISNLFHTPVPFLQEDQFVRRNPNNDLFQKLSREEMKAKTQQVERFRGMFEAAMYKIIRLIKCDQGDLGE